MTDSPSLARTAWLGALGAAVATGCVLLAYARSPGLVFSLDVDSPLARGLYPAERAPDGRLTFAWTRDQVTLQLPGLDRRVPWDLHVRLRGGRPPGAALPAVTVAVDGVARAQHVTSNAFEDLVVRMPAETARARGALVQMRVSNTVVPGPQDPRPLGVMVDEIDVRRVAGGGLPIAPPRLLQGSAIAGAICGLLIGALGLRAGRAAAAVSALGLAQALIVTTGSAPYVEYANRTVPAIAAGAAAGALAAAGVARYWSGAALRRTAQGVLALSGGALFLKLLVLLHPNLPIGDALFHAHRFEWVRDGRWLFTSIAPGGYAFPYPIGLYVFALPFSSLVSPTAGSAGLMVLLRVIVAASDAAAGALLYPAIAQRYPPAVSTSPGAGIDTGTDTGIGAPAGETSWHDRLAGVAAVALFHAVPLNLDVQTVGNLTNAFAQSLFVIAIAGALIGLVRPGAYARLALFTAIVSAALLSHTSTFLITVPMLAAIALCDRWRGRPEVRALALPLLASATVATVLAIALYYAHFGETYVALWQRISGELRAPAELSDPGHRSIAQRIAGVPYYLEIYFGWTILVLAAMGAGVLRRRDAIGPTLAGWLLAALVFLVAGLLTPVDTRHYLAAFPALAVLGGLGVAHAWRRGPLLQSASIVLLAAALLAAVRHALAALR